MGLFVLGLVVVIGLLWMKSKPAAQRRAAAIKLTLVIVMLGLLYLAVTGRLHWLGALIAALIPFSRYLLNALRFLPLIGKLFKAGQQARNKAQTGNQQSRVQTNMIEVTLDHDTGQMQGQVIYGSLAGRAFADLSEQEFIQLLDECRNAGDDSARLLETYLDHRFGDSWREDDPGESKRAAGNDSNSGTILTAREACEILGVSEDASRDEIIQAHRRLMQRLHPDRGGSPWLAAKLNQAKDLLLND